MTQPHERDGVLPDRAGDGPWGPAPHCPAGVRDSASVSRRDGGRGGLSPALLSLHAWAAEWLVWEESLAW